MLKLIDTANNLELFADKKFNNLTSIDLCAADMAYQMYIAAKATNNLSNAYSYLAFDIEIQTENGEYIGNLFNLAAAYDVLSLIKDKMGE